MESECCGASIIHTDICAECGEHCEIISANTEGVSDEH